MCKYNFPSVMCCFSVNLQHWKAWLTGEAFHLHRLICTSEVCWS